MDESLNKPLTTETTIFCTVTFASLSFLVFNLLLGKPLGELVDIVAVWTFVIAGVTFGVLLVRDIIIDNRKAVLK